VRLRTALGAVYAWYRETEPMAANILRDAEVVPALGAVLDRGLRPWQAAVRATLEAPFTGRDESARRRVAAAVRVAVDFGTWRGLKSLGDHEAAELGARLVEAAPAA